LLFFINNNTINKLIKPNSKCYNIKEILTNPDPKILNSKDFGLPQNRERIFIHRGIATRQFQRNFVLADGIEVTEASMDNGLLYVDLSQPINNDQSVKIEIKDSENPKKNLISFDNEKSNIK